ncbi:MAG: hypothetical protein IKW57_01340, partial [Alphaproteobacteria bacterium]|nr:hypothetical protein [Alphaproteobacteria bacterium]
SIGNRMASLSDIMTGQAVGNCQNIKLDNGTFDFDYLVYVLVDNDGFHLFEISGTDMTEFVKNNKFPNWCDSHGSKEKGRNGQFPITRDNIQWHMNTNYIKSVSWIDIMEISKNISLAPNKKS